jgi:hypothetical protein
MLQYLLNFNTSTKHAWVARDCHESNVHQSTRFSSIHAMFGCSNKPRGSVNLKIFKQAESDIRIWRDMNMYDPVRLS